MIAPEAVTLEMGNLYKTVKQKSHQMEDPHDTTEMWKYLVSIRDFISSHLNANYTV